jgi:hypothetical protein
MLLAIGEEQGLAPGETRCGIRRKRRSVYRAAVVSKSRCIIEGAIEGVVCDQGCLAAAHGHCSKGQKSDD